MPLAGYEDAASDAFADVAIEHRMERVGSDQLDELAKFGSSQPSYAHVVAWHNDVAWLSVEAYEERDRWFTVEIGPLVEGQPARHSGELRHHLRGERVGYPLWAIMKSARLHAATIHVRCTPPLGRGTCRMGRGVRRPR